MQVVLKTGEAVALNALPLHVPECGCCGHYHLTPKHGLLSEDYRDDCRYDDNRYTCFELDELFGRDNWVEIPCEEQGE